MRGVGRGGQDPTGCGPVVLALLLAAALILGWALMEPFYIEITHPQAAVTDLPRGLDGLRIAVLTDIHHGPWLSRHRVRGMVDLANAQHPDVTVILGDVVHRRARYIAPAWHELGRLHAPLGVYAVLGNHDFWEGEAASRQAMAEAGITDLEGQARRLHRNGAELCLVGLGDLMETLPRLSEAMATVGPRDLAVVLTHNPDIFEQQHDPRARLWLAGHTHGGQVVLPGLFEPFVPSLYGQKYRAGFVEREGCQIYVSRGLGCITPPLRMNCRPELPVIELRRARAAD